METHETNEFLTFIDLSLIESNPLNSYMESDIAGLASNIWALQKLLQPVTVIGPSSDGKYKLIAGHRRIAAIRYLQKDHPGFLDQVPCLIIGPYTTSEDIQKTFIEFANLEARSDADFDRNKHYMDLARTVKKMAESGELKTANLSAQLAEYMHKSPRYARMFLSILKDESGDLPDLVVNGQATIANASAIANFPEEDRKSAVEEIKQGASSKDVVKKYKEKNKPVKQPEMPNDVSATSIQEDIVSSPVKETSVSLTENASELPEQITAFKGKQTFSDLSFDQFASEFQNKDNQNLNVDATGTFKELSQSANPHSASNTAGITPEKVVRWCKSILKKNSEDLSDAELEAIDACKDVAEAF